MREAQKNEESMFPVSAKIKGLIGHDEDKLRSLLDSFISLLKIKELYVDEKQAGYLWDAIRSGSEERALSLSARMAVLLFSQSIVDEKYSDPFSVNSELLNSISAIFLGHRREDSTANDHDDNGLFSCHFLLITRLSLCWGVLSSQLLVLRRRKND